MNEFTGLGKVYSFTLNQQLKNKSNRISVIILLVFCLVSVPVMSLIGGGSHPDFGGFDSDPAKYCLLVRNETDLPIRPITDGTILEGAAVETAAPELVTPAEHCVLIELTAPDRGGYDIIITGGSSVDDTVQMFAASVAQGWMRDAQLVQRGVSAEQIARLNAPVSVHSAKLSDVTEEDADFSVRFVVTYVYAVLVLILCTYVTTYIVRIIVEEKASRLVELLMVSVQPLALVAGKILAMMVYIFGLFLAMGLCILISYAGSHLLGLSAGAAELLAAIDLSAIRLDAGTVVIVLLSLLLAYAFFSLLAGLAGAGCSRNEEIDGATSSVMFIVLAGYLVSCITGAAPSRLVGMIVTLCPVVNTFCAPVQYVVGNISLFWLIVSWLEQALVVAGLAVLSSRLYRQLILSRGSRIKLRQLFGMAKKEAH